MSRQTPALRWRLLPSLFLCLALAFAPSLAEGRAGSSFGGHSSFSGMGSRGSRTFESNRAAPITRSMTQTPGAATSLGGYGGGLFHRHPFLTGLFGGFLGSMLFHGMGGFGHVFGGLLQFLLIGFLIWFVVRLIAGRGFSRGGMGGAMPRSVGAAAAPAALYRGRDTTVADSDLTAFQSIHAAVQEAWGRSDLGRMRALMTPEMLSYFSEELTRNTSQGVQNLVSDVRLLKGEITESWEEGDLQYATAYLQWTAIDYVVPLGGAPGQAGLPVRADTATPTEAEEVWTFVRRSGGNWLLSAIQQV
ncbi:MAG TPA: TIM44-like domain-containing protein [Stellaceae bacterium]|nr:TIM44-like domain-containing protein [Stellaceae bacterium]